MTMSSLQPSDHESEPQRFGKYVLVRPLRKGGMGVLAVAVDSETGRLVVVKRVANKDDLDRFREEIQLSRELTHPNLVQFVEAGQIEGVDYLALELLAGQDLDLLVERAGRLGKRVTVPLAAAIVRQVCSALEYAHGRGIGFVHRDVKPGNVVACYDGSVKLIDHGGALSVHKRSKTQVGHAFGTVGYWAPEQKNGQPATERSDLYSAAAVFHFLLTGLPCYGEGETNDSKEVLAGRIKPLAGELPRPVLTWLWRALQSNPTRRFESAAEMARALEAATEIATAAELGAFVSHLFTVERQRDDEELDEWRKRYGAAPARTVEKTAVMRTVDPSPAVNRSTMMIDQPARSRGPLVAVAGGAAALVIFGALWWWSHRAQAPQPPATTPPIATAPQAPVPAPPAPVEPVPPPVAPVEPVAPAPPTHSTPKHPGSSAALKRVQEARALIKRDKNDTARQLLAELENDPEVRGPVKATLAELAYAEGEYERAIALASQAVRLGVRVEALQVRAMAELKTGRAARAAQDFGQVLAIDPKNEDAREGQRIAQQLTKGTP